MNLFFNFVIPNNFKSFQTNALITYESSDNAEASVPHALKDAAEGSDEHLCGSATDSFYAFASESYFQLFPAE